ncbi:hypothetical protein RvY_00589 [Ramazzottius varieornatus]|uniref:Uncharacterized protein n=1 Tax=Ramazzottius varieornatus TaxID=947166 RepID=A0A1D1UE83_RAMVA|nr:hypothetical protein RvY_00589 [Ramazzottius varieornatus]
MAKGSEYAINPVANTSDNYNFEAVYFPLRSEERRATEKTKREMVTKRLVPEPESKLTNSNARCLWYAKAALLKTNGNSVCSV